MLAGVSISNNAVVLFSTESKMLTFARSATGPLKRKPASEKRLVELQGLKRPHAIVLVKLTKPDDRA